MFLPYYQVTLLPNYSAVFSQQSPVRSLQSAVSSKILPNHLISIKKYVEDGGSILFIGDSGIADNNQLLNVFGISFNQRQIYYPGERGGFDVTDFIEHPSIGNNPHYKTNWGGSFEIHSSATAIAYTDSLTWRDVNWNELKDANEPSGPFIFMCASEYGQGRAIFIADNAFHDDFIKWENSPNDDLFLNILDWLTENLNVIPTFVESNIDFPKSYKLYQNYPNPFNPTTKIEFMLPKSSKVEIKIYNMLGQEIKTLVDKDFESGNHVVIWDGRDNSGRIVGSGVYLYRIKANDFISVKKGLLLK